MLSIEDVPTYRAKVQMMVRRWDFGSAQAKEMLEHLESVLANEPASVKPGQSIVEVRPQGVSKGVVAEKILSSLVEGGRQADFVLCVGDDRSDEDMFEGLAGVKTKDLVDAHTEVFACTVGQKPSKAKYYLDDTMAQGLLLFSFQEIVNIGCHFVCNRVLL